MYHTVPFKLHPFHVFKRDHFNPFRNKKNILKRKKNHIKKVLLNPPCHINNPRLPLSDATAPSQN